jgi:hypothetical protein
MSSNKKRRSPLHTNPRHSRRAYAWLGAILGSLLLSLAIAGPALASSAVAPEEEGSKEGNANGLNCIGHISAGEAELGSSEQQVRYTFYCNGPITGYSLESNIPLSGYGPQPIVANDKPEVLSDTFSCGGELPGWADNCVGATKLGWENITGQFSIGAPICAEPRVDPLLTVTDIYLEKGVSTQGISGPFDLGRPLHCPKSKTYPGGTRLEPATLKPVAKANKHKQAKGKAKGKAKKK